MSKVTYHLRSRYNTRAMTLVEAVMATLVVSIMLTAALNTVGSARQGERIVALRSQGFALAEELMAEILNQAYADPTIGDNNDFGKTLAKIASGNRSLYDDVDDYDDWSAKPIEAKDGTPNLEFTDWSREVIVDWVDADDLTTIVGNNEGVKRITVTVKHDKRVVAELQAYRTQAWQTGMEAD